MRSCQAQELLEATKGKWSLSVPSDFLFSSISTDSRKSMKGQLFWALAGEQFDAHEFLEQALQQGAAGLVVQKGRAPHLLSRVPVLEVEDTLQALQEYARWVRKKGKWTVVGITGSNGKTSTKEFAQTLLAKKFRVHANKGSFNNHFGLPFHLLSTPDSTEVVIAEMGMNHAGELTQLCAIAEPDIVVCTMVGQAHIEHFGTIEGIARAKNEIYVASPTSATRIYNLDNPWTSQMYKDEIQTQGQRGPRLTFSSMQQADVRVHLLAHDLRKLKVEVSLRRETMILDVPVFGDHNVINLAAAASVALALEVPHDLVFQGLQEVKGAWGRNQFLRTPVGAEILFDAYNANPDSFKALLENVKGLEVKGRRIGVFAEMKELGEKSEEAHRELGERVGQGGFDSIWFYGSPAKAFEAGVRSAGFQKKLLVTNTYEESLASELANMLQPQDLVIVKGSRSMKLESFVHLCRPFDFEK